MGRCNLLAGLVVLVVRQMAFHRPQLPPRIEIHQPSLRVDSFEFAVDIELIGALEPGSLEVSIDHGSILRCPSGGPLHSGEIEPGSPLREFNLLVVRAREAGQGRVLGISAL